MALCSVFAPPRTALNVPAHPSCEGGLNHFLQVDTVGKAMHIPPFLMYDYQTRMRLSGGALIVIHNRKSIYVTR